MTGRSIALFAVALQPDAHFGRVLAAYGGVFCLFGVATIMYTPR